MTLSKTFRYLATAATLALALQAQSIGDNEQTASPSRILVNYGPFDPKSSTRNIPPALRGASDTNLWIVQFRGRPSEEGRAAIRATGAVIHKYMPENAYVVRMNTGQGAAVSTLPSVRWVGHYEPAYRIEHRLLVEHLTNAQVGERRYNILMTDKLRDKASLTAKIFAIGGKVVDRHEGGALFTVDLSFKQMLTVARLDEVLYLDLWSAPEEDMDNARIQGGADYIETVAGYTGAGIRGHVYEGVEFDHPDFNTPLTQVGPAACAGAARHGHCTAGIIFGNGTSHANARGMAPDAVGFFTNYQNSMHDPCSTTRNSIINLVVNTHQCMFTTASWGHSRTTAYTSVSADADDIVFDHRIPWTQSQSNAGTQMSRPQAWAKNVISVGGVSHGNNSDPSDDSWAGGSGSIGPAADGRIKPDLCAYYDSTWTSDLTGSSGYNSGDHTQTFGGTSGATPIVAGHNALAIQMYTDLIFNNPARVSGGTRFQNRPYAQTLKALMIVGARQYTFNATSADNRREHQGWGLPNLQKLYDRRNKTLIVPEDEPIQSSEVKIYHVTVPDQEAELEVCMSYLEPMGNPAATQQLINDLTLRVIAPDGTAFWGNNGLNSGNYSSTGGAADTINSVECVFVQNPTPGQWTIEVMATSVVEDANTDTPETDATFALVVQGGAPSAVVGCGIGIPDNAPGDGSNCNTIPFGQGTPPSITTSMASNNNGNTDGAVYFDVTVNNRLYLSELDINTSVGQGIPVRVTLYRTPIGGSHVGNETNAAAWQPVSHGRGITEAPDTATRIPLDHPIRLEPGNYGFALVAKGFAHRYTNGPAGGETFSNTDLSIGLGSATNTPFTGTVFQPRTANVALHYQLDSGSWTNQRYHTILRSADLGRAGPITGLGFAPCTSGQHWNNTLQVRMSHVPPGYSLSNTFSANLPNPVTVLDARDYSWPLVQDQWNEIGLMSPFAYDGQSDVVIEIIATGNIFSAGSNFRRASEPRVYASGWTGAPPATGSLGNAALKMRVQFGCANASIFGRGCAGLGAQISGNPTLGSTWSMIATGAQSTSPLFQRLGFVNSGPLFPYNLTSIGFPECYVFSDSLATNFALANGAGVGSFAMGIPNQPVFIGTTFYAQWMNFNSSAPAGLSLSEYVRIMVGTE